MLNKILLKPADIIILLFAVVLTIWLYSIFWFDSFWLNNIKSVEADFLTVQIADNPPQQYSLNEDRIIKLEGTMGKSLIEIKQRKARFVHSPCRNQFCVLHGWISNSGDITACLPNQMSISLQGQHLNEKESHFDAIAGGQ